jgi:hypothetical protein
MSAGAPMAVDVLDEAVAAVTPKLTPDAKTWTMDHPGTFVIDLDDARELARRHAGRIAPSELSE